MTLRKALETGCLDQSCGQPKGHCPVVSYYLESLFLAVHGALFHRLVELNLD